MVGFGTVLNVIGILAGGAIGILFGRFFSESMQETLGRASGVGVLFIGISGAMQGMLKVEEGGIVTKDSMMLVISLALGAFIGEIIDIEGLFEKLGEALRKRFAGENDNTFVEGFLSASLTVCIGAMVITGAIADGIFGDWSIFATKAILDCVTVLVMTCSYGKGCMFSAIPCGVIQGLLTLAAGLIKPFMTDAALAVVSFVGSVLIFCIGVNLVFGKKIKVANLIPSIIVAVVITAIA